MCTGLPEGARLTTVPSENHLPHRLHFGRRSWLQRMQSAISQRPSVPTTNKLKGPGGEIGGGVVWAGWDGPGFQWCQGAKDAAHLAMPGWTCACTRSRSIGRFGRGEERAEEPPGARLSEGCNGAEKNCCVVCATESRMQRMAQPSPGRERPAWRRHCDSRQRRACTSTRNSTCICASIRYKHFTCTILYGTYRQRTCSSLLLPRQPRQEQLIRPPNRDRDARAAPEGPLGSKPYA
jgi:hypothetical protein